MNNTIPALEPASAADSPPPRKPRLPTTARSSWRFSAAYAAAALLIFLAEVAIATIGRDMAWLRWYVGDVIVVAWVHCLIATVRSAPPRRIAGLSLAVACLVEVSQYVRGEMGWEITQPVLRIIVGSTADWMDVAAYAVGATLVPLVVAMKAQRLAHSTVGKIPRA